MSDKQAMLCDNDWHFKAVAAGEHMKWIFNFCFQIYLHIDDDRDNDNDDDDDCDLLGATDRARALVRHSNHNDKRLGYFPF